MQIVIDVDLPKVVVAGLSNFRTPLTTDKFIYATSIVTGVSVEDIKGKDRKGDIVTARHIYRYLAKKHTKWTLGKISEAVDGDHASCLHSVKVINNELCHPVFKYAMGERLNKIMEIVNSR